MKSIIISGKQGSGKTLLSQLLSEKRETFVSDIESFSSKWLSKNTKCIVIEGVNFSIRMHVSKLKEISSVDSFSFRPPYAKENLRIYPELVIFTTLDDINKDDFRHSLVFKLL